VRDETVETARSGLQARLIERAGPTGLLLTTTAIALHEQNETRLLTIPTTGTPEQTEHILRQVARRKPRVTSSVGIKEWHALQEWLVDAEHRVVIPRAEAQAADLIPPVAVRLRRDFPALLALIEAHAILHQARRPRAASGAIVATRADYTVVRELVAALLAGGVEVSVPLAVRETVDAVAKLAPTPVSAVTVTAVARQMNLDKSTASRRARQAIERPGARHPA
jgi:hypothetical protein